MKKLITLITLLLITYLSMSQNFQPIIEIEGGYNKQVNSLTFRLQDGILKDGDDMWKHPLYTNIKVGLNFKDKIFIYQNVENFFSCNSITNYSPYQIRYLTGVELKHKNISLIYEHMCSHPIVNNPIRLEYNNYFRSSSDKLTLKIKIY
jgi:hypothetical protein